MYENYDVAHGFNVSTRIVFICPLNKDSIIIFQFPQLQVSGLTAHLCILIAMKELETKPEYDLNSGVY